MLPLSKGISSMKKVEKSKTLELKQVVEDAEKKAIVSALKSTGNNRSEAARLLGISRRALYDKIGNYDLNAYGMIGQIKKKDHAVKTD
jgi:DNA-binding NtrC family response regulator